MYALPNDLEVDSPISKRRTAVKLTVSLKISAEESAVASYDDGFIDYNPDDDEMDMNIEYQSGGELFIDRSHFKIVYQMAE